MAAITRASASSTESIRWSARHRRSGPRWGAGGRCRIGLVVAEPSRRRPTPRGRARTIADDPEHDRGLLPEREGEELDQPLGRRVEECRSPPAKKISWKTSKSSVEGDERHEADHDGVEDQADRAAPDGAPRRGPGGPRHDAGPRSRAPPRRGRARPRKKPMKTPADVAPCAGRSLLVRGRGCRRPRPRSRAGRSRGRSGSSRSRRAGRSSLKPVQAAASERPCSKDTQSGFRNSEDGDRDDRERGRDGDDEIGRAAGEVVHGSILAARGGNPRRRWRYSSSSVFAWSHHPSMVRSDGGASSSSFAPWRIRALKSSSGSRRMSRSPSIRAWIIM